MYKIYNFLFKNTEIKWKISCLILILCNFLGAGIITLEPEILRFGVEAIVCKDMNLLNDIMYKIYMFIFSFIIVKILIGFFKNKSKNLLLCSLQKKMISKIIELQKKEIDNYKLGDLSVLVIESTIKCAESSTNMIFNLSGGIGIVILSMVYMFFIEKRLLLCILIYYFVIRFLQIVISKKLKKNVKESIEANKDGNEFLFYFLKNMIFVQSLLGSDFLKSRCFRLEKRIMKKNWKVSSWNYTQQDIIWASAKAAEYFIVYGLGIFVLKNVSFSTLFSFIFVNDIFNNGLYQFSESLGDRASLEVCINEIRKIMDNPNIEDGRYCDQIIRPISIKFENVSFMYKNKVILDDVSFSIKGGEKILLLGENGVGKSTFLKLISGIYRPQKGKIFFNNIDINFIHINEISSYCSYITQNSSIFSGDVYENIALNIRYDLKNIVNILKRLKIYKDKKIPIESYSMGEKQRINITRAMLKKNKEIILCDEIFSNLDTENRNIILEAFNEEFNKSTIIMINHEKIDYCFDRIIYLKNGKVEIKNLKFNQGSNNYKQ